VISAVSNVALDQPVAERWNIMDLISENLPMDRGVHEAQGGQPAATHPPSHRSTTGTWRVEIIVSQSIITGPGQTLAV
jgi:hypothetical protein